MSRKLEKALKGQVLDDGWVIGKRRVKCAGATGACHSLGFIAAHPDGRKAFVKMMDPTVDPTLEGREQLEELHELSRSSRSGQLSLRETISGHSRGPQTPSKTVPYFSVP